MFYKVWSNHDPNDCFEVEADSSVDAALVALSEVGYSVAAVGTKEMELQPLHEALFD